MKRGKKHRHVDPAPSDSTPDEQAVRGERSTPSVSTDRSLQSRVSSIMACGLMMILGAGLLTWYYSGAMSRQSRARQSAQSAVAHRAQGEMPLPALDGFNSLKTSTTDAPRRPPDPPANPQPPSEPETPVLQPAQLPLMPSNWGSVGSPRPLYGSANRRSAEKLAQERLLSGAAFARESGALGAMAGLTASADDGRDYAPGREYSAPAVFNGAAAATAGAAADKTGESGGDIATLLRPSAIASARAKVLPTQRFLLGKGAFIDCTLETAINSTLPGMTTCITATDTFSSDGTVVLLERGTKLIGETRGQVQQGAARVFVLWTEARTPTGIVVPLDSPGADELGRSGLPGEVNRHFWDRFGAAILISTLDGAVQAAVESSGRGGGAVIYNPSTSESVVTDVLKNSVNIPPTVTKRNGDRIQIFVARDLDFRSVYELRAVTTGR
jgi:type IV secretion system protein VirB10